MWGVVSAILSLEDGKQAIAQNPRLSSLCRNIQRVENAKSVNDIRSLLMMPLFSTNDRNYLCSPLLDQLYFNIKKKPQQWFAAICGAGYIEACTFLLDRDSTLCTFGLQPAVKEGHTDIVRLLLKNGSDVHRDNDDALQIASANGHTSIVQLLLDHGADVYARNKCALRSACLYDHTDIINLLQKYERNNHCPDIVLDTVTEIKHSDGTTAIKIGIKERRPDGSLQDLVFRMPPVNMW